MSERAKQVLKYFEEQKDFVDARVKAGIEMYRKGDTRVQVLDKEGNPVKGAHIEARQTKQAFKFGANLFMIDELETPEKNEIYKKKFPELFNLGTVPFYWRDVEPEEGKLRYAADSPRIYRRPAPDLCVDYCRKNGIEPKLHCLNYDYFTPCCPRAWPTLLSAWISPPCPWRMKRPRTRSSIASTHSASSPLPGITCNCGSSSSTLWPWAFTAGASLSVKLFSPGPAAALPCS